MAPCVPVLAITGPLFALIAVGWLVTRVGLFSPADMRALGRYVVVLALPALIFRAVTTSDLRSVVHVALPRRLPRGLARGARAGLRPRAPLGLDGPAASFEAMGMSCANSGFIGYPALLLAMPAVADRALAMNVTVENLVILPLILFIAEAGSGSSTGRTLRRVATSPIVIGLVAGLAVALSGVSLPQAIDRADRARRALEHRGLAPRHRRHPRRRAADGRGPPASRSSSPASSSSTRSPSPPPSPSSPSPASPSTRRSPAPAW